mmetsp:Transcript_11613/g.25588  ORF Transcript_11613/g.25588 Transcript_11613/m.25588 type:complete len:327 (-) Transcript_11613:192-1172(-)
MATSIVNTLQNYAEDPLAAALVSIGGAVLFKFALGLLNEIYKYFFRPSKNLKKFGKYAIITGATDGIGKAYAFALAKRGLSVILISRTESKLADVAKEIDAKNFKDVEKTKYIVCDYSNFDEKTRARVAKELEGLDIGVLVNNVGQSYRYPRFFHELPNEEIGALIEMNINSTVWMTKFVIEGMVERKRGTIVNLSSGSADYTMPLLAEYAAAKMFVERFSESLNAEYKGKGITVQCQIPFYVATKLAKMRKSLMVPTAESYVWMSMRWIGHSGVVSPYWLHAVQGWVLSNMPAFIVDRGVMNMHMGIRKRGMKKDAKIAAEGKQE